MSAWSISSGRSNLDESFILFYQSGCPVCGKKTTCSCGQFADRSSQLVEIEKILELKDLLEKFAVEVGAKRTEIHDVVTSLEKAASTQSEPVARTAVLEAKKKAAELEATIDRGAKNVRNATSIYQAISKLFENFPYIG